MILEILAVSAMNAIFLIFSVSSNYGTAKKEREKLKIQRTKFDKLSPKNELYICHY